MIELTQTRRGKRPVNQSEPTPRERVPNCPAHLAERAEKERQHLAPILMQMRVLTEAERAALGNLSAPICDARATPGRHRTLHPKSAKPVCFSAPVFEQALVGISVVKIGFGSPREAHE